MSPHGRLIATMTAALVTPTSNAQRTKPITSAKGRGWNGHRFLCVPHRCWGFNVCNTIRQTCVSKVIVFCVTPIIPESFMIVASINVLMWLFQNVGGFAGRSYGRPKNKCIHLKHFIQSALTPGSCHPKTYKHTPKILNALLSFSVISTCSIAAVQAISRVWSPAVTTRKSWTGGSLENNIGNLNWTHLCICNKILHLFV